MRIDSSGNVGIGTASPSSYTPSKLVVSASSGQNGITVNNSGTTASDNSQLVLQTSGASYYLQSFVLGDGTCSFNAAPNVGGQLQFGTVNSSNFVLLTNNTVRMRIDSSGNVQVAGGLLMPGQPAPTSKAAAATLTGAELITGILNTTGSTYTITLPTGTNIEGALTWAANNVALDWFVINTASGTITIAANGNTTLGTLTVATGVSAHFRIRRTATNTFTVYRMC
jgi:hypothetical protein